MPRADTVTRQRNRIAEQKSFASVWDAIVDTPEEAENMKLRSSLMIALKAHMERVGSSQSEAAKIFDVTQPRVSDLVRGKINFVRPGCAGQYGSGGWATC